MQDVAAAILAAQAIVGRAGIEERDPRRFGPAGNRQQLRCRQVGHDQANALLRKFAKPRGDIAVLRHDRLGQGERLAGKMTGSLIVGDTELRPLDSFILRRLVEIRERQRPLDHLRQPPDLHRFAAGTGNHWYDTHHHYQKQKPSNHPEATRRLPSPQCPASLTSLQRL